MAERTGAQVGGDDGPLYSKRVRVHPKRVHGLLRQSKTAVLIAILSAYYGLPWLRWNRGPGAPDQAFLIDMPNRRAYFLWLEIWPQEIYYLAGLLIMAAFGLFLATSLFGRVWCGFACPQTLWTDLFMTVERWIEGDRSACIRLDRSPWTRAKFLAKAGKHAAWIAIAVLTGGAWSLYFQDAPTLVGEIFRWQVSPTTLFFVALFSATTYVLAGIAREQVCTYMCPWPRFQAALFDRDTLIVTYANLRGEPRAPHKKGAGWEGRGHCIDCHQCVAACPTGIDIRDGNQLECIGCGLCIDACDEIMSRVGLPPRLITYDTVARQEARAAGALPAYRLVRVRTIAYGLLLVFVGAIMVFALANRTSADLSVLRDRSPLFVTLADGSIRNGYTLRLLNKTLARRSFLLRTIGIERPDISVVGEDRPGSVAILGALPDQASTYRVYVHMPRTALRDEVSSVTFVLDEVGGLGESVRATTDFRAPGAGR